MNTARVAVVGGGISGLAAAHRLRTLLGPAAEVVVLEQRDRLGGVLRTVDLAGVPYDVGAEAFLWRRPEARALLDELGLADEVVHPAGAAPSVRAGGGTLPLPPGTLLGVPTSAARLDGVLSPAGTAVARAERDRPLAWAPGGDVALGGLLRERFGDELADRLADPLLGGVYAGRVDALGLRATLPAVAAALDAGAPSLTAAADRATAAEFSRESARSSARVGTFVSASRAFRQTRRRRARELDAVGTRVRCPARRLRDARRRARRHRRRPAVDHRPRAAPAPRRLAARPRPGPGRARRGRRGARRPRPRGRAAAGRGRARRRPRGGGDRAGVVRRRRARLPGRRRATAAGDVRRAGRGG